MQSAPTAPRHDRLSFIAAGLGRVAVPWELQTGEWPLERRYERLMATDRYEAWLICWPVGVQLDLHDHGESSGAFAVVAGELEERVAAHGAVRAHRVRPGDTVRFGRRYVHAISNLGTRPATSVHVYTPPLRSMAFYDADGSGDLVAQRTMIAGTDWVSDRAS